MPNLDDSPLSNRLETLRLCKRIISDLESADYFVSPESPEDEAALDRLMWEAADLLLTARWGDHLKKARRLNQKTSTRSRTEKSPN